MDIVKGIKKQATDWEKNICKSHIHKWLYSEYIKEFKIQQQESIKFYFKNVQIL